MEKRLKLPVGMESFKEIRQEGFYYVDKTGLIEQLLDQGSKVTLFPRPRRFGKSLNMSMLQCFFEIRNCLQSETMQSGITDRRMVIRRSVL